ncbi:MFS general substrate transporter [Hypoxylon sp. FL1284]|nr:MFS general substrate transporter [Hypoxylon sp. FL1284]
MGGEQLEPGLTGPAEAGSVQSGSAMAEPKTPAKAKKPFSFYMSVLGLGMLSLISSWDSTSLAVALPTIAEELRGTTLESFWASISFILADITNLKERPLYIGVISVAIAAGTISGPVIGAVFSEFVDWRLIGWVNLPFVGMAFVLAFFFLHLRPIPESFSVKVRGLDWTGMALFAAGASAAALPLSWADSLYSWSSWRTILPFVIGVMVLALFFFYEKREADKGVMNTVLPFRVFANVTSVLLLATGFIHGIIMYSMLLYVPLFFQAVFLVTPLDAAKMILPVCGLVVAFSFIAPVTIEITRRYRVILWIGWLLTTLFLGLWCLIGQGSSPAELYAFQAFLGAGIGILFTGTQVPMQASVVDVNDTGLAVGMLVVFRLFGALVGLAIGSTAFNSAFERSIAALGTLPEQVSVLNDPTQAVAFIPRLRTLDLPSEYMGTLVEAYRGPFQTIWIIMTCLSGVGLFLSLFIKELSLESEDMGRQGFEHNS